MADPAGLRILSLFSGIGGLDEGLRRAFPGARTVCSIERDAFAASVLVARMESADMEPHPVWCGNVREFDARPLRGRVDAVCGGYPCQPFSVAGKQRGEDDPRHLWPEFYRIIQECDARLVFLENVPGHIRLGFSYVLADLAALGFDAEWSLLRASAVGAPHRRERLFVLGYRRDMADPSDNHRRPGERGAKEGAGEDGLRRGRSTGVGATVGDPHEPGLEGRSRPLGERADELPTWPPGPADTAAWSRILAVRPDLAPALAFSAGGRRDAQPQPGGSGTQEEVGSDDALGAGEPDLRAETFSEIRRVADAGPRRDRLDGDPLKNRADRLRALGNAVVPAQGAAAFLLLAERAGLIELNRASPTRGAETVWRAGGSSTAPARFEGTR